MGCNAFMADVAAGQPLYENTWLAAGSILLLLIILGSVLEGIPGVQVVDEGADGYVVKDILPAELMRAVKSGMR